MTNPASTNDEKRLTLEQRIERLEEAVRLLLTDSHQKSDVLHGMMVGVDKTARRINLSIKALEISEEKAAVAQYGSTDSGASLGDILGAVLKAKREEKAKDEESGAETEAPKKATRKAAAKAKPKKETKVEPLEEDPPAKQGKAVEEPQSEARNAEPEKPKKKKAAPQSKTTKKKSAKEDKEENADDSAGTEAKK